jgi:hypothetical protein
MPGALNVLILTIISYLSQNNHITIMRTTILNVLLLFLTLVHCSAGFEILQKGNAILNGRLFVLGVGINDDKQTMQLQNCEKDTRMVAEHIVSLYKMHPKCDSLLENYDYSVHSWGLYGAMATSDNIKSVLEEFALKARPEDYFFFIFNGMSDLLPREAKDGELKETYLFVYEETLKITTLARWLELIPCNNQMIITESGYGKNFGYELIAELSPKEYAYLVDNPRNRIIVTTSGAGVDAFPCRDNFVQHGPLNYFLLNSTNIFNEFFIGKRETCLDSGNIKFGICDTCFLKYDLARMEIKCNVRNYIKQNELYSLVLYEREFLTILRNYLKDSQSRGVQSLVTGKTIAEKKSTSRNIALIIGINEYEGKPSWKELKNPVNDATTIAGLLKDKYGYTTSYLENATKNEILDELLRIKSELGEKDNFLCFIAGHGYYDEEYSDGYIVAKDTRSLNDDKHKSTYIDFASLQKLIGNMPANNIFLIFDVCFGGTFGSTYEDLDYTAYDTELADITIENLARRKTEHGYKSRIYLASGEREVPDFWNNSLEHSPFADKLIKILMSDEAYLTPGYIKQKLELNITEPVLKQFRNHDPKGDFFLIRE